MCGLGGYVGSGSDRLLDAMTKLLAHRGPDARGTWVGHGVGLAATRLARSEEHTSELQSRLHLVCRLLLEKKNHTSELQSRLHLVCRLLLEKNNISVETQHLPSQPQQPDLQRYLARAIARPLLAAHKRRA